MKYKIKSFRHGKLILENHPEYKKSWHSLLKFIENISDEKIIKAHESYAPPVKSLSKALNKIFKDQLPKSWKRESKIFNDENYTHKSWRLDFSHESVSLEVAFNHGEAIAWNLLKPVIASELNHVKKDKQTKIGVIICATKDLKTKGGFDGACGEFEKFERYLDPLRNMLTVPIVVIGLSAPKTFEIEHRKTNNKNHGDIVKKKKFLQL